MALSASEQYSGGEVRDADGRMVVAVDASSSVITDGSAQAIAGPSGGDDYPAISAAVLAKPKVVLGGGTFQLNTAGAAGFIPLPRSSGITVQGAGKDQTVLKLSSACTCAFGITPTAVDQTCGNVLIQDLTIDCNNISSNHAVLFYGLTGAVSALWRTSWVNIRFRRVKLINVPTDTNQRIGVYIRSLCNGGDAFTQAQAQITDIIVEDYEQQGGVYGITIDAQDTVNTGLPCNVLIDRIDFKGRFYHDTGQPGGGGVSGTGGAHIDIGQQALVGTVRIDECIGSGSNDVGIEVDNARSVYCGLADITDFRNHAVYPRNIGYSVGGTMLPHQVHRYEKIVGRSVAFSQGHGVLSGYFSAVYSGNTYPLGDVSVGVLEYDHQLLTDSRMPLGVNLIASAWRSCRVDEMVYTALALNDSTNTAQTIQPVVVQPNAGMYVGIKSLRTQLQGTVACNLVAGTVTDNALAASVRLEVGRHEVDHQLTFTGGATEQDIWNFAGPSNAADITLSGYVQHMRVIHSSAAIGLHFASTTKINVQTFEVDDLDFSGAGAGISGAEVLFDAPSNSSTVRQSNLIYQNGTRFVSAATPANIQVFTATGANTWTKPAGISTVFVTVIAGGAGGGSGRQTASGTAASGGAGGGGGGYASQIFSAAELGNASYTVTVGAGGAGGVAQASASSNGNAGSGGTQSVFGTHVRAQGGNGGAAGSTGSTAASGGGAAMVAGASSGLSTVGAAGGQAGNGVGGGSGGSGGGGLAAAPAVTAGAIGGTSIPLNFTTGGAGGSTDGQAGGAGTAVADLNLPIVGSGGGGGASSILTTGGTGGAGGKYGSGGGGGGCSLNGSASGAGGAGANGVVVVISQ